VLDPAWRRCATSSRRAATPATIEYVDIPGISAASRAEIDLAKLKTVDALARGAPFDIEICGRRGVAGLVMNVDPELVST
jgi:hypothetical protein